MLTVKQWNQLSVSQLFKFNVYLVILFEMAEEKKELDERIQIGPAAIYAIAKNLF